MLSTYKSVLNRIKEIGMLKALGYTNKIISRIIILETTIIRWIGYFLSFIVFVMLVMIGNYYISNNLSIYYSSFRLSFSLMFFFLLLVLTMVIAIFSSIKAIKKISTISPILHLK
jgi:ABC-type antimicrobial peptide transport system permease subunit